MLSVNLRWRQAPEKNLMSSPREGAPKEGSTEAPTRHPLDWRNPDFYDSEKLDAEMRRVSDICHGCRRCFNLCDSFPRLFDLIDESETGELDSVKSEDFSPVVEEKIRHTVARFGS